MRDREDEIENDDLESDEDDKEGEEEEEEEEVKGAGKSFSKLDGMIIRFYFFFLNTDLIIVERRFTLFSFFTESNYLKNSFFFYCIF